MNFICNFLFNIVLKKRFKDKFNNKIYGNIVMFLKNIDEVIL